MSARDSDEEKPRAWKSRNRDERRLTRSNSRSISPPRRRRSRSRSLIRGGRDHKRRRSIERYEPAKRRRNTSSASARDRKVDSDEELDRRSPRREMLTNAAGPVANEMKDPRREASELREKLLREKIKKTRTLSTNSVNAQTNVL
ncbi:hypothetical protein BUE80_DR006263 [Diplocarpon rosae]|nr:hypothetical protein BUE80_DR006263 [Diplocarpon rosae]